MINYTRILLAGHELGTGDVERLQSLVGKPLIQTLLGSVRNTLKNNINTKIKDMKAYCLLGVDAV
jgi:hypothetical protein